jgi:UDP-N-acetyl-D-glucosamine dehydrogenase
VTASATSQAISVAPDGSSYPIPTNRAAREAFGAIGRAAERGAATVVAVQGLGFVGTAVCGALVASGRHIVIGVDLATPAAYWKVATIGSGMVPASPDPALATAIASGVTSGRLFTTTLDDAYCLADVIVVDIDLGLHHSGEVAMGSFERAIRAIGQNMREDALVVIETTVPVGTCRTVALPALMEERSARGIDMPVLLANAYERVMPGPRYLESVRAYPRSYAGVDAESAERARHFLESFVEAPLRELRDLESAELGKLLENSYRAANIALIQEWTQLAESIGVNLWEVVDSIRARAGTHDNIRNPGFGVGGYCLTKDSVLAQWGAERLLGSEVRLETTLAALETNALMPLHTLDHLRELADGDLNGKSVALCGVSYLPDVADTRNSPSETFLRGIEREGAAARVHDPLVVRWPERPDVSIERELARVLQGVDAIVLAVAHRAYQELRAADFQRLVGRSALLVDAQNIIDDVTAHELRAAGWRVSGVGKGHWRTAGYGRCA